MTMTREEQIIEAAEKATYQKPLQYSELVHKTRKVMCAYEVGFIDGCVWADRHPGWTPVEKELPPKIEGEEITKYYWVAGLNGEWYDVLRYDYRDGRWRDNCGVGHACVTHWMGIVPPAPRKEV